MTKHKAVIGITMGDPAGIGPEIILKSFKHNKVEDCNLVVIGNIDVMNKVKDIIRIEGIQLNKVNQVSEAKFQEGVLNVLHLDNIQIHELLPGKVQAMAGNAAFEYVVKAVELALNKEIDAIATAPLNKEAMKAAGHNFPGHTEILAHYSNTKNYAMLLYDEALKVIHVSTHISLRKAIDTLSQERIASVIDIAHETLKKLGYENPRIAVAGINPHAGEGGLFGDEEEQEIIPAINRKRSEGISVEGPISPDTIFLRAKQGEYDIVVAMYHDQGHIPLKLIGFHSGVNVTAGLPIIRTSVDHGTAFEIAWKGIANEESMLQSIELAKILSGK
ncbi:4-hydroxythreonine-4-phosphate dehydrogenase PdxA [Clostridium formicaceticum]|uniref:Putative D-threonate 4-phosphate dehydrogenase n=1 Tax=Clostridium formicaceticum TaxID=1497 RepID=A0AAC9RS20_9CLOT|nr:4-hydroxythreonine-4-phosphate dehydrogenase PdxA [Clostridium formicaceticum]AOY75298.1 4-hydroxythreonine-4-phosphate dehydrogenase PdxA [Clostridium formicaceticum]ARE89738.1 4-hydroxythreonine-4-phosphate dehydrogenase 2 [Clostridium formicaceticum]